MRPSFDFIEKLWWLGSGSKRVICKITGGLKKIILDRGSIGNKTEVKPLK